MRIPRRRSKSEEYAEALLEGIKIGVGGVTEMLDGLILGGFETMELVEVRSFVEQMRMRAALGTDTTAIAAEAVRRAAADGEVSA